MIRLKNKNQEINYKSFSEKLSNNDWCK